MSDIKNRMEEFVAWLGTLDYFQRAEVLDHISSAMCLHCGGDSGCCCWNDE
ncbi:MAG: hypothetical protein AB7L09_02430 [Nitrospira sp.]